METWALNEIWNVIDFWVENGLLRSSDTGLVSSKPYSMLYGKFEP